MEYLPRRIYSNRLHIRKSASDSWGPLIRQITLDAISLIPRYGCPCNPQDTVLSVCKNFSILSVRFEPVIDYALPNSHNYPRGSLVPDDVDAFGGYVLKVYSFKRTPLLPVIALYPC